MKNFVTAYLGSRDSYQLPVALQQAGKLQQHISDFYCPDTLINLIGYLDKKGRNRHHLDLPSSKVRSHLWLSLWERMASRGWTRRNVDEQYLKACKLLSQDAAKLADETDSDLFLYSEFAYWAFIKSSAVKKLLFQFHPHFSSIYQILKDDIEIYPEMEWSFAISADSQPPLNHLPERLDEWKYATRIACASTFTKRSLEMQGCPSEKITVIPYGYNRTIERTNFQKREAGCRFLFVGQGIQRKGIHHLLRAWHLLNSENSHLTIVAKVIDPGIKDLIFGENITLLPYVDSVSLENLYLSSDVFVMPSLVEGFGLVYPEALSHGLFCIGTRNTGLPDLNLDNDSAAIVDAGDIEAICGAMLSAIYASECGRLSKRHIQENFSHKGWEKFRAGILDFSCTI